MFESVWTRIPVTSQFGQSSNPPWISRRYNYILHSFQHYLFHCAFLASSDYASLDTVVVFPVGSSEGDRQCLNVTILSDDAIEGTEHFFLKVSSVETLSLIVIDPSAAQTIVSIADRASEHFRAMKCLQLLYVFVKLRESLSDHCVIPQW